MASDKTEEVEKLAEAVEATRYNFNPEMCGDRYKDVMDSHQDAMSTLTALKTGLEEAAAEKQQELDQANKVNDDDQAENRHENQMSDTSVSETNEPAKDPLGFPVDTEGSEQEHPVKETVANVVQKGPVVNDEVIVNFLTSQLDDVTDFGYLLVPDDGQLNGEALRNLKAKFKAFINI